MASTKITAEPGLPFIDIEREFEAPRELVFRAWTEPELLVQWLGPRRLSMTVEEFDLRDGGRWRYANHEADGSATYRFHGVFHGTPTVDGMVQTFEFEGAPGQVSLDRMEFVDVDGRTLARSRSVFQSVEARDAMVEAGMERGLSEGFEKLDELLSRHLAGVG